MANRLSPTAAITSSKSGSNPTFNFDSLPANAVKVGATYYAVYQSDWTGGTWAIALATASAMTGPWTHHSTVLTASEAWETGANVKIQGPHLVRSGDTFYIFYAAGNTVTGANGKIGVASATTVTGTYTKYASNPILEPGATGLWDSLHVSAPAVIYDGTQWVMAYSGESDASTFQESRKVGIATASSPFGPWSKDTNNPLIGFGAAGEWDDGGLVAPHLFTDSGYYWIMYSGQPTVGGAQPASLGLAYASAPSGPWTRHASNPFLAPGSGWEAASTVRGSIYPENGTYHVIYAGFDAGFVTPKGGNATLTVTTSTDDVGVWLDFNQDGFGSGGSSTEAGFLARMMPEGGGAAIDDNITADVMSYSIHRGAQSEITGAGATDSCTIVVKNSTGKFTPDNTSSAYATLLRPGCPVWIGVNGDGTVSGAGTVYGRFAGVVREIAPIPSGAGISATAEIICDGILADYALTPAVLEDSTARSQQSFRRELLLAMGEAVLRMDLDDEPDTLPLSSADSTSGISVLDDLNRASGTRHFIKPSASLHHWYDYTTRNRNYKLGAAADDSIDAGSEHLTEAPGWRYNNDSIVNSQRASIDPISFTPATATVWEYAQVPFGISGNVVIWANFDDYVASAALSLNTSSGSVTSTLTPLGRSAKIELYSTGATITELSIEGSQVERDSAITVSAEDLSSQSTYRVRAGSDLSGELLGTQASAQGIVDHIVYRYGNRPLKRPSITVVNWLPNMFALDPYDLLGVTINAVSAAGVKFEIVGIDESCDLAASASAVNHQISFQLAEARIQGTQDWFTWDESVWDGPDLIAY